MASKTDREVEKQEKAASKELAVVFKSWVSAVKSKDAVQIAALEDGRIVDDTFLFAAGGFAALAKGTMFRDEEARVAVLRLLSSVVSEPVDKEVLDDINAPAEPLVRRVHAFLEAASGAGAAMSGAEGLVAAVADPLPQTQMYGLRCLRAVASSMLSAPASDQRNSFIKDCLLSGACRPRLGG